MDNDVKYVTCVKCKQSLPFECFTPYELKKRNLCISCKKFINHINYDKYKAKHHGVGVYITCDCGSRISVSSKAKHIKSNRHLNAIKQH